MVSRLRYSVKSIKNKKHSKPSKSGMFIKNSIQALVLCLPLLQCGSNVLKDTQSPVDSQKHKCSLSVNEGKVTLYYKKHDKKLESILDVPEGVNLNNPELSCQEKRTIILTPEYAGRALGSDDLSKGNEMLGALGGEFFYQNAIFLPLSPLGEFDSAEVSGSILIVTTKGGEKYRLDLDNPQNPAKLVQ